MTNWKRKSPLEIQGAVEGWLSLRFDVREKRFRKGVGSHYLHFDITSRRRRGADQYPLFGRHAVGDQLLQPAGPVGQPGTGRLPDEFGLWPRGAAFERIVCVCETASPRKLVNGS